MKKYYTTLNFFNNYGKSMVESRHDLPGAPSDVDFGEALNGGS